MATIIHCFLFTWKGQYENTVHIESILKDKVKLTVVNTNCEKTLEHWINIGEDQYFGTQFRTALELFDGDILWNILADVTYDNWEEILNEAIEVIDRKNCGVYAPNLDDTFYIPERTDVFPIEENLMNVATTDGNCWFISKEIVEKVKEYSYIMNKSIYGWGWDLLACGFSHLLLKGVIRDYSLCVNHPKSTGYKKEEAEKEMGYMFNLCPPELKQVIYTIKVHPDRLKYLYFPDLVGDNLVRVYRT